MTRHHRSVFGDLAPALSLFKSAAGETAPMWRVSDALDGVLVAGDAGVHDDGRHLGLLHEVLRCAAAEVDDPRGFRFRDDSSGLHHVANDIEGEAIASF